MASINLKTKAEFTQVVEQNKGIIYKVVNSYCQKQDDRQDLAQEILVQLWLSFDKYDAQYKLSTWMYRISLNVAISYYRKDKRRKDDVALEQDELINIVDCSANTENTDEIKLLYKFIAELDKLNKAIMLLYLESESYENIAQSLGLTKTNVATRIGRIKELLKTQFLAQESKL